MMRYIFLFSFFLLVNVTQAQLFTCSPDTLIQAPAIPNVHNIYQINMDNQSGADLDLTWRLVEDDLPTGWTVTLCDNVACYGYMPNTADCNTIGPDEYAFMKMDFNPGLIPGVATFRFRVYPTGEPMDFQVLTFIISSGGTTSVQELSSIAVYPNPVDHVFNIDDPNQQIDKIHIFNALGQKVGYYPGFTQKIYTDEFRPGTYFLKLDSNEGKSISLPLIIQ